MVELEQAPTLEVQQATRLLQLSTFEYAVLGVTDVESAVDFYTRGAAMRALPAPAHMARLATADGRVRLVLTSEGPGGLQQLGYAVTNQEDLTHFDQRLAAAGIARRVEAVPGMAVDALCFDDPDGYHIALIVRQPPATEPAPRRLVAVSDILHPLIQVRSLEVALNFYRDVLGFQVSDFIGDVTAFMRCADGYHHSLAITVARSAVEVDHLCFSLADLDTVMRARNRLRKVVTAECTDVFRHGGSESITFYFQDPFSGVQIEYCAEHRLVTDPQHQPRVLPPARTTFDLWERYDDSPLAL